MKWLWSELKKNFDTYRLSELTDFYQREDDYKKTPLLNIICDIDKTYLETEFDTFIDIAKIAFEDAQAKTTVQGASELLHSLRWQASNANNIKPLPLHFVSSSPPQLRRVLEEKFLLDGLDWTSDTFKNQAYNLKKIRVKQLRQHVAYKVNAILDIIISSAPKSEFCLIGDDAEADAYIYFGIKILTDQDLSPEGFAKYLSYSQIDSGLIAYLMGKTKKINQQRIKGIFIRKTLARQTLNYGFKNSIYYFENYFEASLMMIINGILPFSQLWPLIQYFHNRCRFPLDLIATYVESAFDLFPEHYLQEKILFSEKLKRLTETPIQKAPAQQASSLFFRFETAQQANISEEKLLSMAENFMTRQK
jgi:hypothetical protein